MATENHVLIRTYPAGEDLTADQFRIVVLASGAVRRPDGATEVPLGVLQNAPASGEAASVMLIGVSKIVFGETVAENEWINWSTSAHPTRARRLTPTARSTSPSGGVSSVALKMNLERFCCPARYTK